MMLEVPHDPASRQFRLAHWAFCAISVLLFVLVAYLTVPINSVNADRLSHVTIPSEGWLEFAVRGMETVPFRAKEIREKERLQRIRRARLYQKLGAETDPDLSPLLQWEKVDRWIRGHTTKFDVIFGEEY